MKGTLVAYKYNWCLILRNTVKRADTIKEFLHDDQRFYSGCEIAVFQK